MSNSIPEPLTSISFCALRARSRFRISIRVVKLLTLGTEIVKQGPFGCEMFGDLKDYDGLGRNRLCTLIISKIHFTPGTLLCCKEQQKNRNNINKTKIAWQDHDLPLTAYPHTANQSEFQLSVPSAPPPLATPLWCWRHISWCCWWHISWCCWWNLHERVWYQDHNANFQPRDLSPSIKFHMKNTQQVHHHDMCHRMRFSRLFNHNQCIPKDLTFKGNLTC